MLFKLSNLNSNLALTLGYLNPALNNSALKSRISVMTHTYIHALFDIAGWIKGSQRLMWTC